MAAHVPEWVSVILGKRNFLEVALDVRMTASGAADRSYASWESDQEKDINILRWKLDNWEPGLPRYQKVDNAVRTLIKVVLEEVEHG